MLKRILDSSWFYFGLAALLVVVGLFSQIRIELPPRNAGSVEDIAGLRARKDLNVVFILIDTLRADHLSSYGYARPTSPFMDRLAREGVRFANVEAQSSWTKTSMASLWTGLWPIQTGVMRWDQALSDGAKMPAEVFEEAGIVTAGLYRNGWVAAKFGFGQGFQTYILPIPGTPPPEFQSHNPAGDALKGSDADITQSAMEFLHSHAHERFFLYLHMMDVHQYAYDATTKTFGTTHMDAYDTAISWVDHNLGVLAKSFADAKILDKTIFVIASDHGEAFGEHGREGHARNLYNEVTEVPLIVSLPFTLPDGVVVDELVRNVDVFPTVLDLVGLPPLPGVPGRSLVPLIEAAARGAAPSPTPPPAFAELDKTWGNTTQPPNPLVSLRTPDWKLFHLASGAEPDELYDLQKDPLTLNNVLTSAGTPLAELQALISQYLTLKPVFEDEPKKVELDSEQLQRLRALGYILN